MHSEMQGELWKGHKSYLTQYFDVHSKQTIYFVKDVTDPA